MATHVFDLPAARTVLRDLSREDLRARAAAMPNAVRTTFGNVNVRTRVVSRSTGSTFLVSDEPVGTHQTLSRAEYERVAALQDAYVAEQEMLLVNGAIGSDPDARTAIRLYVEAAHANVAGMQQQLYFPPGPGDEPGAGGQPADRPPDGVPQGRGHR